MNIRQIIRDELIKVLSETTNDIPLRNQLKVAIGTVKSPALSSLRSSLPFSSSIKLLLDNGYTYRKIKNLNPDIQFATLRGEKFCIYPNTSIYGESSELEYEYAAFSLDKDAAGITKVHKFNEEHLDFFRYIK